jgi:hypothetical protein
LEGGLEAEAVASAAGGGWRERVSETSEVRVWDREVTWQHTETADGMSAMIASAEFERLSTIS